MDTPPLPLRAFAPSSGEVRETRSILTSLGLATELVLQILDYAKYWTTNTTENIEHMTVLDEDWDSDFSAIEPYLWVPLHLSAHPTGEIPKVREIEFIIVAHDQGWTTEGTMGSYDTSSWFEVSRCRPKTSGFIEFENVNVGTRYSNLEELRRDNEGVVEIFQRHGRRMEPQRLHCPEMRNVTWSKRFKGRKLALDEGTHAWWLQGNQVARSTSIFEGEMVKRYRVVWGCAANPVWEGNEGAGKGEDFVDSLREGDRIAVWARAKRRGWENHVFGVRAIVRYTI